MMGMSLGSSCSSGPNNPDAVAPNPRNFKIIERRKYEHTTVLHVNYPNCTNYEGRKILVFKGIPLIEGELDPHFSEYDQSLIARFAPTEDGWIQANDYAFNYREAP